MIHFPLSTHDQHLQMSSSVIVQVQRHSDDFRAFLLKNGHKLCFSSGVLSTHCVCPLAMNRRLSLDLKAKQAQHFVSDFGLWTVCD